MRFLSVLKRVSRFCFFSGLSLVAGLFAIVLVGNLLFSKSRTEAFRVIDPSSPICEQGKAGWSILSQKVIANDEYKAISSSDKWREKFACSVQTHIIPSKNGHPELRFHLAFLEFNESGVPYPLLSKGGAGVDVTQLDALVRHLRGIKSNYVVAFVHGWRHDASLGDDNVGYLRIYAAQAARFIAERCETNGQWCSTEVTGIYVGWPGARVDEQRLKDLFGSSLGEKLGTIAAVPTLFDRKPVSEAVAPAVYSALDSVASLLQNRWDPKPQKMIVFGHSLGGNLLITALRDALLKAIRNHRPGDIMESPLADLVVLINPASEASNWTVIQREVWDRIPFTEAEGQIDDIIKGHKFFNLAQRPLVVSATAARNWPPGGFRAVDCRYLARSTGSATNPLKAEMQKVLRKRSQAKNKALFDAGVDYDWATYDLFPAFRGDLRPLSSSLKRYAAIKAGYLDPEDACAPPALPVSMLSHIYGKLVWIFADWLNYIPFLNTEIDYTRTIGHVDLPRPAVGSIVDTRLPRRMLGTTHELLAVDGRGSKEPSTYENSQNVPACPTSTNWLWHARRAKFVRPNGVYWDSADLDDDDSTAVHVSPALRFIHGFGTASMAPITRANDPFWNVRAFDNALARHDGFLLPSFICGMNQLVLDDPTPAP